MTTFVRPYLPLRGPGEDFLAYLLVSSHCDMGNTPHEGRTLGGELGKFLEDI